MFIFQISRIHKLQLPFLMYLLKVIICEIIMTAVVYPRKLGKLTQDLDYEMPAP